MKKIILMFALMMGIVVSTSAQTAIEKSKFFDNTYVGVQVGATTPLSFNSVFPLNTTVGLRLGKDITPVFGLNVEGTAWLGSACDDQNRFDVMSKLDDNIRHKAFRGTNIGVNASVNLSNLFGGYKGTPRMIEVSTVTGLGWGHVFAPSKVSSDYDRLTVKTGVDVAFNLGKKKAHTIYVEPAVLWILDDHGIVFQKKYAYFQLAAGYTYHFKTSNGTHHFKVWNVGAMNDEINTLRSELAKKPTEVVREVVKTVTTTETVSSALTTDVTFEQNSYTLSDEAKAALDKVSTDVTVNVIGTASPEGIQTRNEFLSKKRAEVVADYLRYRGVKVDKVLSGADSRKAIVTQVK